MATIAAEDSASITANPINFMAGKTKIEIRLTVSTMFGPVGPRLNRGNAKTTPQMPPGPYDFPDTPKGRAEAEKMVEAIRDYIEKWH